MPYVKSFLKGVYICNGIGGIRNGQDIKLENVYLMIDRLCF
jgi:hypothetical protein